MQNNNGQSPVAFAGFWVRLAAWTLDWCIVSVGLAAVRLTMSGIMSLLEGTPLGGNLLFTYSLKDIVLYIGGAAYYVLCTYYAGTTLGKRALNLKVVSADGRDKLTFFQVLYRETVGKFLSGFVVCVGYILIGIDREKRGLHDILADTRVVYGKRIRLYPVYPAGRGYGNVPPMPGNGVSGNGGASGDVWNVVAQNDTGASGMVKNMQENNSTSNRAPAEISASGGGMKENLSEAGGDNVS